MSVKFAAGGQDVVKSIRSDNNPLNWVVVGYSSNGEIEVQASGEGGINELRQHLDTSKIQYGMLRLSDVVDGNATTKFVFVVWLGDQVKTITKARVTTHRGDVKDWFGQAHVTIDAANLDEITEDLVMGKVSDASGTSVRVLKGDQAGDRAQQGDRTVKASQKVDAGVFEIANRENIKAVLAEVRNGTKDWVLLGYAGDSNTVELKGSGTGGADELAQLLDEGSICYGLVRVGINVDGNDVTRFCLVSFVGEGISAIRKGKTVSHKEKVVEFIGQYHVDINATERSEVSAAAARTLVERAAGTADHERAAGSTPAAAVKPSTPAAAAAPKAAAKAPVQKYSSPGASLISNPKKGNAVNTSSVALDFEDAEGIKAAIAAVRADADPSDWVLLGYANDKTIQRIGSGGGGADEMARHITSPDDGAYYAYLRIPTVVDGTSTVKFVFVMYQGDKIKVIRKAKLATHVGAIADFIGQFHLKLEVAKVEDVSAEKVKQAVDLTTFQSTGGKKE